LLAGFAGGSGLAAVRSEQEIRLVEDAPAARTSSTALKGPAYLNPQGGRGPAGQEGRGGRQRLSSSPSGRARRSRRGVSTPRGFACVKERLRRPGRPGKLALYSG
jgi:hypothetical protein